MRPRSYVGITGFERSEQVNAVRTLVSADRLIMVGCGMRGHPTLWNPDKWPNRCPPPQELRRIFVRADNVLNMLHFSPLEGCDLYDHLCLAHETAGPGCNGIQLNTPWPDIDALYRYKSRFNGAVVTVPLQHEALDAVAWNPQKIARRLREYGGVADYTLIDPSAGYGQELDVAFTERCFRAIRELLPDIGLVAAGGLNADNVKQKLGGLLRQFALSTDAEGKLRYRDDQLNLAEAIRYAMTTATLLREYEEVRNPQPVN